MKRNLAEPKHSQGSPQDHPKCNERRQPHECYGDPTGNSISLQAVVRKHRLVEVPDVCEYCEVQTV